MLKEARRDATSARASLEQVEASGRAQSAWAGSGTAYGRLYSCLHVRNARNMSKALNACGHSPHSLDVFTPVKMQDAPPQVPWSTGDTAWRAQTISHSRLSLLFFPCFSNTRCAAGSPRQRFRRVVDKLMLLSVQDSYMLTYMLTPPFGTISIRGTVHRDHSRPHAPEGTSFVVPLKGRTRCEIQISARTCFKVAGLHVSTPRDLTGHSSPNFLIGRTRFSGSRNRNRGQIHQRSDRYF